MTNPFLIRLQTCSIKNIYAVLFMIFLVPGINTAQFIDNFDDPVLQIDHPSALKGWTFYTGDGSAVMDFKQNNGYASIYVDATHDKLGIWWALIRRAVFNYIDLKKLTHPDYELRLEARIRVSDAPRRVNLHFNTQSTRDFHSHLMEYDIPDTVNWHTISMTTNHFGAGPGDSVYAQLALMDWGLKKYRLDIDFFKVNVVSIDSCGPDLGAQMPYHPPIPPVEKFKYHIPVVQDATIDTQFTDRNFNNWGCPSAQNPVYLLSTGNSQLIILRWDLSRYKGQKIEEAGLLEITTYALAKNIQKEKDFGLVRIAEIFAGENTWDQTRITYSSFFKDQAFDKIINAQMIIDIDVNENNCGTNLITISKPVLQRLIDGKTVGLAIRPLGAIYASFYAMENRVDKYTPKLHFNMQKK